MVAKYLIRFPNYVTVPSCTREFHVDSTVVVLLDGSLLDGLVVPCGTLGMRALTEHDGEREPAMIQGSECFKIAALHPYTIH